VGLVGEGLAIKVVDEQGGGRCQNPQGPGAIKVVDEHRSEIGHISNTGSCGITCSSVAIPRIVFPALVMAADGLGLPSVSLNIARFFFFALPRH
jgi:hypothetical protein